MKRLLMITLLLATFAFTKASAQNSPEFLRGAKEGKKNAVEALLGYGFWTVSSVGSITPAPNGGSQLINVAFDADSGIITLTYAQGERTKVSYTRTDLFIWYYLDAHSDFDNYSNQYLNNIADAAANATTPDEADFYMGLSSGYLMGSMLYR